MLRMTTSYETYLKVTIDTIKKWQLGRQRFTIQTSGSTGKPKDIRLEREMLTRSSQATAEYFGIPEKATVFSGLPPESIGGFMMIIRSLVNNWNLYAAKPSGNPLEEVETTLPFSFGAMLPLQLDRVLRKNSPHERFLINQMRALILGGAPVHPELAQKIQELRTPVYHTYGMTETMSHVAARLINGPEGEETAFTPIPGNNLTARKDGRLEITILHGKATQIITNDVVEFNHDGTFRFLGRWDNIINTGGIKVSPETVEKALKKAWQEAIDDNPEDPPAFLVFGREDAELGQRIEAVTDTVLDEDKIALLKQHGQNHLSKYELPKTFHSVEKLIYNENGKLNRKATLDLLHAK